MEGQSLETIAKDAKQAKRQLALASVHQKNYALKLIAQALRDYSAKILAYNQQDIRDGQTAGLCPSLIDRLSLDGRLDGIVHDVETVISLPDPVGEHFDAKTIGNLQIVKQRTPIGVLGVIYEARPNVTVDIATLAIKSGNAVILRGGSEAIKSNQILVELIQKALKEADLPPATVQLITSTDRQDVQRLLRMHSDIDLIIPRGGAELQRYCQEHSTIPVIYGGIGICHLFVDESASHDKSITVICNAKTQRPTVCNAVDTILVHQAIASSFIPNLLLRLADRGVTFKLDPASIAIVKESETAVAYQAAADKDWDTEWLSLTLGVKVVPNIHAAIDHINIHSSGHSDGILTETPENGKFFISHVDSAAVYVNASTRFTDGSQLGLGSEVAISTQKLHARGPMGLNELTSYKWVIHGTYTVRQ